MKRWKLVTMIGLITITLIGCNSQPDEGNEGNTLDETQSTQPTDAAVKENAESTNGPSQDVEDTQNIRTYVNQTDAWVIELPVTWNDVHVVESSRMTEFIFPSQNPEFKQSLFWITAISEEEWEKAKAEGPTGSAKEITNKDGDVYLYYTPLDQVLEGEELKRYEKMVTEIPAIINSFKFE